MYDIIFISYDEPNAERNWKSLKEQFPRAKRVSNVKGIHQAHIAAAKKSFTKMFWVVDADAIVEPTFKFDYKVDNSQLDHVFIWHSRNPLNNLEYGYGGVKLLPTKLTSKIDTNKTDMTTSISEKLVVVPDISNVTAFNTDPFNTWKSAFRECAKLASKTIDRQNEDETNERLRVWTSIADGEYNEYALRGARAGMEFGLSNKSDISLINDFDWLEKQFKEA